MKKETHICPILLRAVAFEGGKCMENCAEQVCPILQMLRSIDQGEFGAFELQNEDFRE